MRTSRVEATKDVYRHLYGQVKVCYRSRPVSRWLSKDVITMPLGAIEAEISSIKQMPARDRSVADVERLADLRDAKRRITGGSGRDYV
jgi:hypothetical protein